MKPDDWATMRFGDIANGAHLMLQNVRFELKNWFAWQTL